MQTIFGFYRNSQIHLSSFQTLPLSSADHDDPFVITSICTQTQSHASGRARSGKASFLKIFPGFDNDLALY